MGLGNEAARAAFGESCGVMESLTDLARAAPNSDNPAQRAIARANMSNNTIKIGGTATGSFVAGNNNRVETTVKQAVSLPDPATVRIADELAGLRAVLVTLKSTDAAKLGRALDDAEEEAKKPAPDKHEVGSALERALKVATKASDFAESGVKLAPYVKGAVAWLGANWLHLLPMVGL